MGIFDGVDLSNEEKIQKNISLSDVLSIYDIAELWSDNERQREIYMEAMLNAFKAGYLKGTKLGLKNDFGMDFHHHFHDIQINKSDLNKWLEHNNEVLPNNCLLINWLGASKDKIPGNADNNRLISLELFVAYVWIGKEGIGKPELPYAFPCQIKTIHAALIKWEEERVKNDRSIKKSWDIADSTFRSFWKDIKKREEICRGISRGENEIQDFFEELNL